MSEDISPARKAKKEANEPTPIFIEAIGCNLLEPFDLVWFLDGKPKEVVRITPWLQMQIDAGLLKQV